MALKGLNKNVHVFSVFEEAVNFAQSLGISFLLILPNDLNEDALLLESFQKKIFYGKRLTDFEEERIVSEILNETTTATHKSSFYKVFVFFTREDFEGEIFIERDVINWETKEAAEKFNPLRKEYIKIDLLKISIFGLEQRDNPLQIKVFNI